MRARAQGGVTREKYEGTYIYEWEPYQVHSLTSKKGHLSPEGHKLLQNGHKTTQNA